MRRLLLVGVALVALTTACTNRTTLTPEPVPTSSTAAADPQEAASQQTEVALGQAGSVGGAEVSVDAPYWTKASDYGTEEGFQQALFQVTWKAIRDRVTTPTFTVTMDGGEEFTRNPLIASNGAILGGVQWEGPQLPLTMLDTGDQVRGVVAFVLPHERGTLVVTGDTTITYRFGPDSAASRPSGYGSKIINRPVDPATETQALNERFAAWDTLTVDALDDVRVAKLRWDNDQLVDYVDFWISKEMTEERSYPYPFTGNPEAAQGVLYETGSPLLPTGTSERDVCEFQGDHGFYRGGPGDHTRLWWGWIFCRGQYELVHARFRYFRDAQNIDHATVALLKTPPLGG
jgi:hypothetical protein